MVAPILESGLDTPRWVMYKCHDVIAWGICCKMNCCPVLSILILRGVRLKAFSLLFVQILMIEIFAYLRLI